MIETTQIIYAKKPEDTIPRDPNAQDPAPEGPGFGKQVGPSAKLSCAPSGGKAKPGKGLADAEWTGARWKSP